MSESSAKPGDGINDHLESSQEHVRAAAADVCDAAAEAARDIKGRANAMAGEWKELARDWQDEAERYVRKNPAKTVLSAVGVGFLIGLLCRK